MPIIVELIPDAEKRAAQLAVASAMTCYSGNGIVRLDSQKYEKRREMAERIRLSTLAAGHNTTRQHQNFTFTLSGISRQVIWSFLHSHPFYNSEQVSQRYVEVKKANFTTPSNLTEEQETIFQEGLDLTFEAYKKLGEILAQPVADEYYNIFPARQKRPDIKWQSVIKKKAQEAARYVLPVAAHAYMYHTISALTLMRMHQCADLFNVPTEQRELVNAMVVEVVRQDPSFLSELKELKTYDLESSLEYKLHQEFVNKDKRVFRTEFDEELGGLHSKLIGYDQNAQATLAKAVRATLQVSKADLPDERALELLLNPKYNTDLGETNNILTFTKLGSAMPVVSYTFQKKLSHSGDSQNQRHRMTPGVAPIFYLSSEPDVVLPIIVEKNEPAKAYFDETMEKLWKVIGRLRDAGAPEEAVQYLAPNAVAVRLIEQGNLRDLHHKYRMRLCYNAQEEIWRASKEEVEQIATVHPTIGKYLLPPCSLRKLAQTGPVCPEGDHYCGVPVWKLGIGEYARVI